MLLFVLGLGALVAGLGAPTGRASGSDAEQARSLLERARSAALRYDFDAVIVMTWQDGARSRTRRVEASARAGVLRLGDGEVLGDADQRVVGSDDGWHVLWEGKVAHGGVDPARKYLLRVREDVDWDGRAATRVIAVRRGHGNPVRERLTFDDETGLLLRRVQFDDDEEVWRDMQVMLASVPVASTTPHSTDLPGREPRGHAVLSVADVGVDAPRRLGDGFELTGAYRRGSDGMQWYYSDGLHGISVFERDGDLAWDELPEGGRDVAMAGTDAHLYTNAAGTGVVWASDGRVYTLVSEIPSLEVAGVIADLADGDEPGMLEEVTRFVTAPFSWS